MKISVLIQQLEEVRKQDGDLDVRIDDGAHGFIIPMGVNVDDLDVDDTFTPSDEKVCTIWYA